MVLKTNVEENHAFTAWWIIFNNPGECVDTPCGSGGFDDFINGEATGLAMLYASGNVSRRNGVCVLVARLKEGEITEGVNGKLLGQEERFLEPGNSEGAHAINLRMRPSIKDLVVDKGEGVVDISIEDSGRGIPPEQLPYIFDRFFQAESSFTRHQEGTGIGLALAKELVELHYGTIKAISKKG